MRTGTTRYGNGDLLSVPALRKDGRRISVEFSILPFHDADGKIVGMGATLRDVTARFEELKALRKAASAAQTAAAGGSARSSSAVRLTAAATGRPRRRGPTRRGRLPNHCRFSVFSRPPLKGENSC